MGWAEYRVKEYGRGQCATWLERRALEHANHVHLALDFAAGAGFAVGLWMHNWLAIGAAAVVALSGPVYCWTWKPSINPHANDVPGQGEGKRRRPNREFDASGYDRAGKLVRALSCYGSHGRARRAVQARDHREREAS